MKERFIQGTALAELLTEEVKQALGYTPQREKILRQIRHDSQIKTIIRNRQRRRASKNIR